MFDTADARCICSGLRAAEREVKGPHHGHDPRSLIGSVSCPMWEPAPALWVVTYVLQGKRRATRHAEGCGVLARARLNDEDFETRDGLEITQHGVLEDGRYLAHAPADYPAPVDHSCVARRTRQ